MKIYKKLLLKVWDYTKKLFKPRPKMNKELLKYKSKSFDMGNLMNDINKSRELYKELSRSCHPDRFINAPQYNKAVLIMQEITKNKRNYNNLIKLQKQANNELFNK